MAEKIGVREMVLHFLEENKHEAVSGEEIASQLGVSRNAVWKAVKGLREAGYGIESVTNKGYTLVDSNNILSSQGIEKFLREPGRVQIEILPSVDSTNNYGKKLAAEDAPEGTVVISEQQTAGKGRLGRQFLSPPKTGLYMSLVLRPRFSAQESLSITTAAAVAVAQAVEEVSGREAQIKWVNDVYLEGKKICGILTEASLNFENGGLEYAVLGIGINVKEPEGGFPGELARVATAVFREECGDETRCRLAACVVNRFFAIYDQLPEKGFLEEYRRRSFLTGKEVTFTADGRERNGLVEGIDDEARLIVTVEGGREYFSAGEVQLKKSFR